MACPYNAPLVPLPNPVCCGHPCGQSLPELRVSPPELWAMCYMDYPQLTIILLWFCGQIYVREYTHQRNRILNSHPPYPWVLRTMFVIDEHRKRFWACNAKKAYLLVIPWFKMKVWNAPDQPDDWLLSNGGTGNKVCASIWQQSALGLHRRAYAPSGTTPMYPEGFGIVQ